eukprot:2850102-Prorocentrum_lima.AAC.1
MWSAPCSQGSAARTSAFLSRQVRPIRNRRAAALKADLMAVMSNSPLLPPHLVPPPRPQARSQHPLALHEEHEE